MESPGGCDLRLPHAPRSRWKGAAWTLTALSLVVSHLIAAAVIIPTIAARLAERNPRRA